MLGHYVIKREKFERWLTETPLFKSVRDGGYARVDQRKLSVEIFAHERLRRYAIGIESVPGKRPSSSTLVLEFASHGSDTLERPTLKTLIEELRIERPAESAGQILGPQRTPPSWDVLGAATEEGLKAAKADRDLLLLAAREILAAIEQLQEHQLP